MRKKIKKKKMRPFQKKKKKKKKKPHVTLVYFTLSAHKFY